MSVQFSFVTTADINKLLRKIYPGNATGVDKIPPDVVKITVTVQSKAISEAINKSVSTGIFPDHAKTVLVFPIDKGTDNKDKVSNFVLVSVYNTFSKIYKTVFKDQIVNDLESVLPSYIAAYRKSLRTIHAGTNMIAVKINLVQVTSQKYLLGNASLMFHFRIFC